MGLRRVRKLHIGGKTRLKGWEVLNVNPGPAVDHTQDATDLSSFSENTFKEIYASHVVEHFDYANVLLETLKEWIRVLKPGGKMYISVPDMDTLCRLFLSKELTGDQHFFVMRMMFGGHVDDHDYHVVGLNQEFLTGFLQEAGFASIRRVANFDIFDDTSRMQFMNVPVSLNMIAQKP